MYGLDIYYKDYDNNKDSNKNSNKNPNKNSNKNSKKESDFGAVFLFLILSMFTCCTCVGTCLRNEVVHIL